MTRGAVFVACVAAGLIFFTLSAAAGPLRTAVTDPIHLDSARDPGFTRVHAVGATMVRLTLNWRAVAQRPPANPGNPNDPAYSWARSDREISALVAAGLEPIVTVMSAPSWAEGAGTGPPGTNRPDPDEFGAFARAAALRYSGRVRYWMAWNEPNRDYYFMPQYVDGRLFSPSWYRMMVNRFADAVHSVSPSNVVIAGGLAPLGRPGKPAPLVFMRAFLSAPVSFDVWSHHPYTSGGPTHHAQARNDVSLGDLPEMRAVLRAAVRAGRVRSSGGVGFWVTEFSWDSNPPDPQAVGALLHARWVSEALYRMWRNGVSVVTWFRIKDDPLRTSFYQSGFYRTDGRAKLSLKAFRFPVVAFRRTTGVYVWGRTPAGRPDRVVVQIKSARRWRTLAAAQTNAHGIFAKTYRTPIRRGHVRARLSSGELSRPFSLARVPDRYVNPFGCGGGIRC